VDEICHKQKNIILRDILKIQNKKKSKQKGIRKRKLKWKVKKKGKMRHCADFFLSVLFASPFSSSSSSLTCFYGAESLNLLCCSLLNTHNKTEKKNILLLLKQAEYFYP